MIAYCDLVEEHGLVAPTVALNNVHAHSNTGERQQSGWVVSVWRIEL
jgi:hypothetical protein